MLAVDVTLSGDVINDPLSGTNTELGAFAYIFNTTQLQAFIDNPGDPVAALGLSQALADEDNLSEVPANPDPNERNPFALFETGSINQTETLSINIGDGSVTAQQFYVGAILYGIANGDGNSVSSLNSLSLSFTPGFDTSTVAAASAVPLPPALWLLVPAVGWLGGRRRLSGTAQD